MDILIVGSGRIGSKVIQALEIDKANITVIDLHHDALAPVSHSKRVTTIAGNGMDRDLLSTLDIENFDYCLSLTDSDKTNILVCTTLKKLGAKYTIARINNTESINELFCLKESLGIDYIVNPHLETSRVIRKILEEDSTYQSDYFANGRIEIVGHPIEIGSPFEEMQIKNIGSLSTVLVAAILREKGLVIPNGDTKIEVGDYLYLIGLSKDIVNFKNIHFKFNKKEKIKNIAILGANGISEELAKKIEDANIKIIVKDEDKLTEMRDKLPEAFIVKQKLTGADFFKDEEIDEADAFIALTDNDELNIVLSIMAKKIGVKQVISRVDSINYARILDEFNFITLNPWMITSNTIIKKLREGNGISIHLMFGGEAEVSEIKLSDDLEIIGKTMKEADLPKGVLIGGIIRDNGTAVVPRGKTKFEKGDTLVIFCKNENKRELMKFINPTENRGLLSDLFLYN